MGIASPPIPPADLEALKADVLLLSVNEPPSPIAGRLREAIDEIARLRAENAELKDKLIEAVDSIETWAAYADEYFQAKWGLRDELAGYRAFLSGLQGATDNAG
jgi:hypothetical protein